MQITSLIFDTHDQKQLHQQYERQVLIPFLQNHTNYSIISQAIQGDKSAQTQLGTDLQSLYWLEKAATQASEEAYYQLGLHYDKQNKLEYAISWYKKAAEKQHVKAIERLVKVLYEQDCVDEGIEYSLIGYSLGSLKCCNNLALFYLQKQGLEKQGVHMLWHLVSSEQKVDTNDLAVWQYNYGRCFEDGEGTPIDYKQAREWYEKAKQNGYPKADEALQQIQQKIREKEI